MKFIHRTNYWGEFIDSSNLDPEIDFCAIWAQALNDYDPPCCPGFGRRSVMVDNFNIEREFDGYWSLFKVSERYGDYNSGHYFYKFVAIPQGTYGYGKRGCFNRGWTYEGAFDSNYATTELADLLRCYLNQDEDDFIHVHVGFYMDTLYAPS